MESDDDEEASDLEGDDGDDGDDDDDEEMMDDDFGDLDGVRDGSMGSQDEAARNGVYP